MFERLLILLWLWPLPALAASSEAVKEVARELVCLCGDCNRESLATCLCSHAQSDRGQISAALDAGRGRAEIVADFIARYGEIARAAPTAEGFNLMAWIAPFAALLVGIVLLRSVVLKWRRGERPPAADPPAAAPPAQGGDQYRERLRRELSEFDEE